MTTRRVLVVVNPSNAEARRALAYVHQALGRAGVEAVLTAEEGADLEQFADRPAGMTVLEPDVAAQVDADLVVVLGGDGTVLRGAELTRLNGAPLLGVNLGHVGFLAEAEADDLSAVVDAVVNRRWEVEERLALDIRLLRDGTEVHRTWALNEIALEKRARQRVVEVLVEIDGRPLSRWSCDGVVCATPTGSTAYAFSAGGPVVWPEVSALLVVPLSAHALFARPLVVSPTSVVAFETGADSATLMSADGRRLTDVEPGSRIEVRQHDTPVRFARLAPAPFTDRLVAKFDLPVQGWRGRRAESSPDAR